MATKKSRTAIVPIDVVQQRILILREQRVILDVDLASIYGVSTKAFNQQIKRNINRFPADFMFRLTRMEKAEVVTNCDHLASLKFSSQLPYAFTEHGAIMAATVLNSERAVNASLFVVRAFVKLRELLTTHHQLAHKLDELERKLQDHDGQILGIIDAIRQLMEEPEEGEEKSPVGFHTELKSGAKRKALSKGKRG